MCIRDSHSDLLYLIGFPGLCVGVELINGLEIYAQVLILVTPLFGEGKLYPVYRLFCIAHIAHEIVAAIVEVVFIGGCLDPLGDHPAVHHLSLIHI